MAHPDELRPGVPAAASVMCPDSLGHALLTAASRALRAEDSGGLDRTPMLGRHPEVPGPRRPGVLARTAAAAALPPEAAATLDAGAIAKWIVDHYPAATYPAAVLGSPHGAAVHLATALGAPWLPSGFVVTVSRPRGAGVEDWREALDLGRDIAACILTANPGVSVRQVYDPVLRGPLCAGTITLHVRWRRVPHAYRVFLRSRLRDNPAVMFRDLRNWPVRDISPGYGFQLGSPAGGWSPTGYTTANPAFARLLAGLGATGWDPPDSVAPNRYAEFAEEPEFDRDLRRWLGFAHRVFYPGPAALSAFVADLERQWWQAMGAPAQHCVVETGPLVDPWRVRAAGIVPYWCESAACASVEAAELWLAGSEQFEAVSVLPQPPGVAAGSYAPARLWRSLAAFARHRPLLDRLAISRYPLLPLAPSHLATALTGTASRAVPGLLPVDHVVAALHSAGPGLGMLTT